ncbi:hypothetical protein [Reyranella sp.]|jgi:hypothetical protein|uniref:hypothetical protein n=1 Tax=Reyranella sp. TaxID=1929291 RepID=UPI000BC57DC8|nr:hypothetical protein [Reyranella sp.]OYY40515.1 MAG: hypothetical protein B7Y57_17555 [Rhodospirillales bacterium 35-66-84]OYZ93132.1 MAG: hypothetical protein B7Y08_18805 [Rhodospirillales bacterium 24-66-33]OZB24260.1 MAG: hypothetical protein B7X63_16765 [Rhodospirillales bacterium 39-66-50]HQS18612.1 hypothetical protein [Reyranella sp.]HQT14830.1 hypothetical protein [Reyranella sp.]
MKTTIVQLAGNVPAGTRLWLTGEQAVARAHLLSADKPNELEKVEADIARAKQATARARKDKDESAIERAEGDLESARKALARRRLYTTNGQTAFKAGEEIAIESDLDRGLEQMLGIAPVEPARAQKPVDRSAKKSKAEQKAAEEAEQKAAEEAGWTAAYDASAELKAQFPKAADYIASRRA